MSNAARTGKKMKHFSYYDTLHRLQRAHLVIHLFPDEEWMLSCARHRTLLVDIYTLSRNGQTYQCGRLCELLLRVLYTGRTIKYHSYLDAAEGIMAFAYSSRRLAETLEEDALLRLRSGDIRFFLPQGVWRLTHSHFGQVRQSSLFYLAEEQTLGTPEVRSFRGIELDHVLLEFLCQQAEFVERVEQPRVLTFKGKEQDI